MLKTNNGDVVADAAGYDTEAECMGAIAMLPVWSATTDIRRV